MRLIYIWRDLEKEKTQQNKTQTIIMSILQCKYTTAQSSLSAYANTVLYFLSRESEQLISHRKVHETLQMEVTTKQHTDIKKITLFFILRTNDKNNMFD